MEKLFLQIINMSMTASYVILFVILIRFLLKKVPKIYSYSLWLIVLFRLLVPFSFSSAFSMIPVSSKAVPSDIMYSPKPEIHSGITTIDKVVNNSLPAPAPEFGASINPIQIWISLGQLIWLVGILILLVYSVLTGRISEVDDQMEDGDSLAHSQGQGYFLFSVFRRKSAIKY